MANGETKTCDRCGRSFAWRKKWARDWANVRYCSDACRASRPSAVDRALEESILSLLAGRRAGATICPSEAARQVQPGGWEALMPAARQAANRLVARGVIEVTQGGRVVDPSRARGPIRLRRAGPGSF